MDDNLYMALVGPEHALKAAQFQSTVDSMRDQNRLRGMQLAEYQKSQQYKNSLANVWDQLSGGQQQPQQQPGQGQAQPQQQPQGSPQQGQQQPNPSQQKLQYLVTQAQMAIQQGDNAALQKLSTWGYSQPDIAPMMEKMGISSLSTSGPNIISGVLKPEAAKSFIEKNPQYKDYYEEGKPLRVDSKNGQITNIEAIKNLDTKESEKLTDEQIVKGALKEKLGREPTMQELQKAIEEHKKSTGSLAGVDQQAKDIGDAIMRGEQPPTISGFGMAKLAGPIKSYLAKQGFNLKTAELDYLATKKFMSSLNSTKQISLRQAVNTAYESLDKIDSLAQEWKGGKFPTLNKAKLIIAKNGGLGPTAQKIATQLEAQISDVTSELGNVYMGGNSPTDHALQLAAKNLSADWTESQLLSMTKLARTNLQYRQNSMTSLGAAGLSTGPAATPAAETPKETRTITRTGKDKSGKKVVQYSDGSIEYSNE